MATALQFLIPLVTLVLGAWFSLYISRPKLTLTGSGSGGGQQYHYSEVRIENRPGLFGISMKPTVLFGHQIHGDISKGLPIERKAAIDCSARLVERSTHKFIAPLYWRPITSWDRMELIATIAPNEIWSLMLFARAHDEPLKYFVYRPANTDTSDPEVPLDALKFTGSREFTVEVYYSHQHQVLRFDTTVTQGYDGTLTVNSAGGGGSF